MRISFSLNDTITITFLLYKLELKSLENSHWWEPKMGDQQGSTSKSKMLTVEIEMKKSGSYSKVQVYIKEISVYIKDMNNVLIHVNK